MALTFDIYVILAFSLKGRPPHHNLLHDDANSINVALFGQWFVRVPQLFWRFTQHLCKISKTYNSCVRIYQAPAPGGGGWGVSDRFIWDFVIKSFL